MNLRRQVDRLGRDQAALGGLSMASLLASATRQDRLASGPQVANLPHEQCGGVFREEYPFVV